MNHVHAELGDDFAVGAAGIAVDQAHDCVLVMRAALELHAGPVRESTPCPFFPPPTFTTKPPPSRRWKPPFGRMVPRAFTVARPTASAPSSRTPPSASGLV